MSGKLSKRGDVLYFNLIRRAFVTLDRFLDEYDRWKGVGMFIY